MATRRVRKSVELSFEELINLPIGNSKRTFLAFGRAMAAWARLERGFYSWFERITGLESAQARPLYFSATGFNARVKLIRAALEGVELPSNEEAFIKAAMKLANGYNPFRNKLAHGEFTFDGLIVEGKYADRKRARDEAVSGTLMEKFAKIVDEIAGVLSQANYLVDFAPEDDDELRTIEQCTKRLETIPKNFDPKDGSLEAAGAAAK